MCKEVKDFYTNYRTRIKEIKEIWGNIIFSYNWKNFKFFFKFHYPNQCINSMYLNLSNLIHTKMSITFLTESKHYKSS